MKSITLALVVLVGILCLGASDARRVTFSKNVSLEVTGGDRNRDFEYRKIVEFDMPMIEGYFSYNVSKVKEGGNSSAERDVIVEVAACLPSARPAFGAAAFESNRTITNTANLTLEEFNVSANLIGGTYGTLCEMDKDNKTILSIDFDEFNWVRGDPEGADNNDNAADGIFVTTFIGTCDKIGNASVNVTFMAANRVGEIDLASTVLTPRSFSSAISISNWSYANTTNHLEVTIFAATASMEIDTTKTTKRVNTFKCGKDEKQVYFMVDKKAKCNGEVKPIKIQGWKKCENRELLKHAVIKQLMEMRFTNWEVYNNTVVFEPEVKEVEYSCGCGSGPIWDTDDDDDDNASMYMWPSFALLAVLMIFM